MAGGPRGGSAFLRDDGRVLTLADRIQRHYTTSMSTLHTAAAQSAELLLYTYNAMRNQASSGQSTFLIPPNAPNFQPLIDLLGRQSIQVGMLAAAVTVKASRVDNDASESQTFPAGTAVVSTRQPLGGLAQTLLERTPTFTKGFVEAQRQKTEADEPNDFYDLTSWSLPLAMDVEAYVTSSPLSAEVRPFEKSAANGFRPAAYGYLIDGNDPNIYRAAGQMLIDGVRFNVSEDPVTVADHTFSRGTIIILKGGNKAEVDATLARIARDLNLNVFPLESGWTVGTAFGSERIQFIRDPKIALVGGSGVGASSYGMLWHTLDIDTPTPHSNLFIDSLRGVDLSHYNVLILPDGGGYSDHLGKAGITKLQGWVRNGGTIVAIKGASSFLRDKEVEISKLKSWEPPKKKDDDKTPVDERYNDFRIPGPSFRTTMNELSYLTFGVPRSPYVLIEGAREEALVPVSHRVDNIVTIAQENPLG